MATLTNPKLYDGNFRHVPDTIPQYGGDECQPDAGSRLDDDLHKLPSPLEVLAGHEVRGLPSQPDPDPQHQAVTEEHTDHGLVTVTVTVTL